MDDEINANIVVSYCKELSDAEYQKVKAWFREEDRRRIRDHLSKEKREWVAKLRKMRKGHKLLVKHNLGDIPAGSIVKLVTAKGRTKWISILHKKKEWDVPADCLCEPDDKNGKLTADFNNKMSGLFS